MTLWTVVSLGVAIARLQPTPPTLTLRACAATVGTAAEYLVDRLRCSDEEARRASAKMLPKIRSELDFARADAACAGLRSALRLDDGELRKLVLRLPPVLSLSVDDNIAPSLQALQALLGVDEAELGKLVRRTPSLIAYDSTRVEDKLAALAELFNGTDTAVAMARREPALLTYDAASVEQKLGAFGELLPGVDARKLLASTPRLLALDPRGSVAPKLEALQNLLPGVDVLKLVAKAPQLLEYDVDGTLRPKMLALRKLFGDGDDAASPPPDAARRLVAAKLLANRRGGGGGGGLAALKQQARGRASSSAVGLLRLASLDLAVVEKRISLLTELLPEADVATMVSKQPGLLRRDVANSLAPRLRFLEEALMSRQRAAALVSGNPRLLLSGWGVLGRLTFARELAVEELQKPSALIMAPKAKFDAKFPRYKVWLAERLVEAGRLPRKGGRVQEEFLPGLAKLEAAHGIVLEEAAGAAEDT